MLMEICIGEATDLATGTNSNGKRMLSGLPPDSLLFSPGFQTAFDEHLYIANLV